MTKPSKKLDGIADLFLTHNRDILIRCDDSVMQQRDQDVQLIRRARGFTPVAVRLPYGGPSVIATGPWLKNTACLTKGDHAFLTQHIGDTDRVSNCRTLARAVEHLSEIFEITPKYIACDLHPDFYSTSLAEELADKYDAELVPGSIIIPILPPSWPNTDFPNRFWDWRSTGSA